MILRDPKPKDVFKFFLRYQYLTYETIDIAIIKGHFVLTFLDNFLIVFVSAF